MRSIFGHPGHASLAISPQERAERLGTAGPERQTQALLFLSEYAPAVFDAVLDAVEPRHEDAGPDLAPFCGICAESVGIFLRLGPDWRHYRGEEPAGPFEAFDPGHEPVITWRQATSVAGAA